MSISDLKLIRDFIKLLDQKNPMLSNLDKKYIIFLQTLENG